MKCSIRFSFVALVLMTGCGSGNEPMSILGDPTQSLGAAVGAVGAGLALPIATSTGLYSSIVITPFTTANPFIGLQSNSYTNSIAVLAPGTGTVVDISNQSVTIFHNAHVISRVLGVLTNVQVGAYVTQGATIGTALTTTQYGQYFGGSPTLKLYVYADNIPVCPITYLNLAGRTALLTAYSPGSSYNDPCQ
jgi:hypothetical protein